MKEGRNGHYNKIFRRKEGRMKEGRSIIMKYLKGRMKEGMSIIMKYLEEGRKNKGRNEGMVMIKGRKKLR